MRLKKIPMAVISISPYSPKTFTHWPMPLTLAVLVPQEKRQKNMWMVAPLDLILKELSISPFVRVAEEMDCFQPHQPHTVGQ